MTAKTNEPRAFTVIACACGSAGSTQPCHLPSAPSEAHPRYSTGWFAALWRRVRIAVARGVPGRERGVQRPSSSVVAAFHTWYAAYTPNVDLAWYVCRSEHMTSK